jgi:hypothetical protein
MPLLYRNYEQYIRDWTVFRNDRRDYLLEQAGSAGGSFGGCVMFISRRPVVAVFAALAFALVVVALATLSDAGAAPANVGSVAAAQRPACAAPSPCGMVRAGS